MIDIEKCPLRPFEQDLAPALQSPMQINNGVCDVGGEHLACRKITFIDFVKIDRLRSESAQNGVVLAHLAFEFFTKQRRLN